MKEGWIKVSERLPQEKELVLLYNKRLEELHIGWFDGKAFMYGESSSAELDDNEISHWQALPADPKDV